MSCLITIVGIPLAVGFIGYFILYLIRANKRAREYRRAEVRERFNHRKREEAALSDPWQANPQDSKFFDDDRLL